MSFKLDFKRKVTAKSNRAKCVDIHPIEPWFMVSLYNGIVNIWNYSNETLIKTFNISTMPVRAVRFVTRKCWFISASDDLQIYIYNYNTMEKVHSFEAHSDYIRSVVISPNLPYVLSAGDDMLIKLWDWDSNWQCVRVFEGHHHYIMSLAFNPKDPNVFASASLDKTIKIWQIGFDKANLTLEGHSHGTNCVDYCYSGDKPYLISGGDDGLIKIWDYQTKACIQTLSGHTDNVITTKFHPELPLIFTGSEDGTLRVWNSITYKLENVFNYGYGRIWDLKIIKGVNGAALACDEASLFIQLGEDTPKVSMDSTGKLLLCKNSEIFQANTKVLTNSNLKDGEIMSLVTKELGTCELFPNKLIHSPNGKYVAVVGSFEYIVYTALALRSKVFGKSESFAWSFDSNSFAIIDSGTLKIYRNFHLDRTLSLKYHPGELFDGILLGVGTKSEIYFYNWSTLDLIHRIDITPYNMFWSNHGNYCTLSNKKSFYILKYNLEKVNSLLENNDNKNDDGIEGAFDLVDEFDNFISCGIWVGDCFFFVNSLNKLCYVIGNEIVIVAHMEKPYRILNFVQNEDKIYLGDKSLNVISYKVDTSVLRFQTLIIRGDVQDTNLVQKLLDEIPLDQCTRIAHFLQARGLFREALSIATDDYHRFNLALKLVEFDKCFELAKLLEDNEIWKKLAIHAIKGGRFDIARDCLWKANDYATLVFFCYCIRDGGTIRKVASIALENRLYHVAFLANHILGNVSECAEILVLSQNYPESVLFTHTYKPIALESYFEQWKHHVAAINDKFAASLASPLKFPEMFPKFHAAFEKCSQNVDQTSPTIINSNNNNIDEMLYHLDINRDSSTDDMMSAEAVTPPDSSQSNNSICESIHSKE